MNAMNNGVSAQPILAQLTGATALQRERGALHLQRLLRDHSLQPEDREMFVTSCPELLQSDLWTHRLAAFTIAEALLGSETAWSEAEAGSREAFAKQALRSCVERLEDAEPRVRLAVGACLHVLAQQQGVAVWEAASGAILASIERSWDRDAASAAAGEEAAASGREDPAGAAASGVAGSEEPARTGGNGLVPGAANGSDFVSSLLSTSYVREAPGTGEMRHGTEGWHSLETSLKALQQVVEGCGGAFCPCITPELRALLLRTLLHPNRFARETAYHILAALFALCAGPPLLAWGEAAAERLQDGLSENWSQVRYAACVAARAFMLAAGNSAERFYPTLLPPLAFNRYDVAEGVASYSRDTWRLVMGDRGRAAVAACLPQVLGYYMRCARTNNHTVREAACACIAELAAKIGADAVAPHVPAMLRTLLTCLRDDSWPVRDAALLASARCARALPAESRAWLPDLEPLWLGHLDDNIPSVREDAAIALGDVVCAYGQEALAKVLPALREMLPRARAQPPDDEGASKGSAGSSSSGGRSEMRPDVSPAGARIIPIDSSRARAAEEGGLFDAGAITRAKKDTGGIDYSCGCMDYGFRRPKQPWEASDGAVYLLRELAQAAPEAVPEFLPELAEVAGLEHYERCCALQETVWRQLPAIAAGLGKRVFKRYMDAFLGPLFACLACQHQLCRTAAGRCAGALRDSVGPGIFAGHLTEEQAVLLGNSPDVPAPKGAFSSARPGMPHAAGGAVMPPAPWMGAAPRQTLVQGPTRAPWAT